MRLVRNLSENYHAKTSEDTLNIANDRSPEVELTYNYVIKDVDDPYKIQIIYSYPEDQEDDLANIEIYTRPVNRSQKELQTRFTLNRDTTPNVKRLFDKLNNWISKQSGMTLQDLSDYLDKKHWLFDARKDAQKYLGRKMYH